ncbi:MAG: ABC transporter permease [Sphaerobacter sp.]|nr:ABC transporter permease [Sphaerobacter sp.]
MSDLAARPGPWEKAPVSAGAGRRCPRLAPLAVPALLLALFLAVPLLALVWRTLGEPGFLAALQRPLVLRALRLSALTTLVTLAVAVVTGTPLAYLLARRDFRGKRVVESVIDLPLVLPPVVAGVALLMAFGRRGLLGEALGSVGIELPFTTAAVVLAQIFVSVPFYVRGARVGFQAVPVEIEEAAAIDGADAWQTLRRVTVPLALPGLASGLVLCWARALSEFGATLMFAGNFTGRTQTMPLAIMSAMETDLSAALALAVLLLAVAATVLLVSRLVAGSRPGP